MKDNFVIDEIGLTKSVEAFFNAPEYWREVTSSHPKYFVHLLVNGVDKFGLSKYCAYDKISVIDYVQKYRYLTDGGTTQKHISRVTRKEWIPFSKSTAKLQKAFEEWFYSFYPTKYDLKNIHILSLNEIQSKVSESKSRSNKQTPESLQNSLKLRNEIGKVGEEIAYLYEINRLKNLGIKNPEKNIDKTFERNVNAGFDIWSKPSKNESRYIEVKSTTKEEIEFFITSNEIEVLKKHKESAYIYFVFVEDVELKIGKVLSELQNPIEHFENTQSLKPILFTGKFINKTV